jgi:hypothetical protein
MLKAGACDVRFAVAAAMAASIAVFAAGSCLASVIVEKTEVDLGTIYRDEPQKMVFPIRNASADSLHVLSIEPSCDCTTAQAVPEVVPPQDNGEVVVFFDPMGYEGRGQIRENVRVFTSDKQTPEIVLAFAVDVEVGPEPEPRSLAFGEVPKGATDTLRIVVHPGKMRPLGVLGVSSDDAAIGVKELGEIEGGGEEIAVAVTNKAGGGQLAGFVNVRTDDSLKPDIRVPVTASFPGDVAVQPDVIVFGPTLPGGAVGQSLHVFSPANLKFAIVSVTSSIEQIAFDVRPSLAGGYDVAIRVKPDARAGRVMGEITIATDLKDEPPIRVKVTGHVRSSR